MPHKKVKQSNAADTKKPQRGNAEASGNEFSYQEENVMTNISTAKSNVISFRSAKLLIVDKGGEPFIPMKPVVDGMGLDWKSQYTKLQGGRFNSTMVMITTVAEDGKRREMSCLPLKKLPGWLMSIHASKVRADLREGVIAYQNECDDVLWEHWDKKHQAGQQLAISVPTDQPLSSAHKRHVLNRVAELAEMDRKKYSKVWRGVQDQFQVASYKDIPDDQYPAVCEYLMCRPIGAAIPTARIIEQEGGIYLSQHEAHHLYLMMDRFWKMFQYKDRMLSAARALGSASLMDIFDFLYNGHGSCATLNKRKDELEKAYHGALDGTRKSA